MHQSTSLMTQSDGNVPKTNSPKVPFLTPTLKTLKISQPKVEKPTSGTELYHHANFYADWPKIHVSVPRQKYTFFLIGDSNGGLPSDIIHF